MTVGGWRVLHNIYPTITRRSSESEQQTIIFDEFRQFHEYEYNAEWKR